MPRKKAAAKATATAYDTRQTMKTFTPQLLLTALRSFPATHCYWLAYSGGCDSHVLLHAMSSLRVDLPNISIKAIHVDHGLNPASQRWSEHCKCVAHALDIHCEVIRVDAKPNAGESPEAAARVARYKALAVYIQKGDVLVTAHHQDDQAETVLLQLLRGAGPAGLAAMPAFDAFSQGWLARPLLNESRAALMAYAEQQQLRWVNDESNFNTQFKRNVIRHQVMPLLQQHWPAAAKTLVRAASHSAEANKLLDTLAQSDVDSVKGDEANTLFVSRLKQLDDQRQRNVLRKWISDANLPCPSTAKLQRLQQDMLYAKSDRNPHITWPGGQARRYRDILYLMPAEPAISTATIAWDINAPLALPSNGILNAYAAQGQGISRKLCALHGVSVRYRQGGEHCQLVGHPHSHSLKHLFQEHAIPPWQRHRMPLIYLGENLAAIADLWICQPYQAGEQEAGWAIEWHRD